MCIFVASSLKLNVPKHFLMDTLSRTKIPASTMDIDYNMPVGNMQSFYERKLSKFLIMFDNSNLLYFPGQFLSGRVIVELQDEMAITGRDLCRV